MTKHHVFKTTTDKLEATLDANVHHPDELVSIAHVGGRDWVIVTRTVYGGPASAMREWKKRDAGWYSRGFRRGGVVSSPPNPSVRIVNDQDDIPDPADPNVYITGGGAVVQAATVDAIPDPLGSGLYWLAPRSLGE